MEGLTHRRMTPFWLLAPAGIFALLFFVGPLLAALVLSFTNWTSLSPPRFVGWANYLYLLTRDPVFWIAVRNTVVFSLVSLAVITPLSLILALGLRRSAMPGLWRAIYWLPGIVSIVAVAFVWESVLSDPYGLFNRMLAAVGVSGPAWLHDPAWSMAAVIGVYTWVQLGQDMMLMSAGLGGIAPEIEDAGRLDGASGWTLLRYVILPLLGPTLLFVVMTGLIRASGFFALMLVLTDGGPVDSTNVLALQIYRTAFGSLKIGLACAGAYILLAFVLGLTLLLNRWVKQPEGSFGL